MYARKRPLPLCVYSEPHISLQLASRLCTIKPPISLSKKIATHLPIKKKLISVYKTVRYRIKQNFVVAKRRKVNKLKSGDEESTVHHIIFLMCTAVCTHILVFFAQNLIGRETIEVVRGFFELSHFC